MEVILQAGWDSGMPTTAEAQNMGEWARVFGPGGTFWATRSDKALASRFIEFGNENSYSYKGTQNDGGTYALRFKSAYDAMQADQPRHGPAGPGRRRQLRLRHLGQRHAHRGPEPRHHGRRLDRPPLRPEAAAGSPASTGSSPRRPPRAGRPSIPIDITEWGISTDNGAQPERQLRLAHEPDLRSRPATTSRSPINAMLAYAPLASRLRVFTYFQGHDQLPSGTGQRERYFGVMKSDGSAKGALTTRGERPRPTRTPLTTRSGRPSLAMGR